MQLRRSLMFPIHSSIFDSHTSREVYEFDFMYAQMSERERRERVLEELGEEDEEGEEGE